MKVMVMAFDGDTQTERPTFTDEGEAWDYCNDLGSKWFFYPFCFLVSDSGKTIVSALDILKWAEGKRVETVSRLFALHSKMKESQGMDCDAFMFFMMDQIG